MSMGIQTAKTEQENLYESYNQDLKKYLSALVFSPKVGEVAIITVDRTCLWENDQAPRTRNKDLTAVFSSMTAEKKFVGECIMRTSWMFYRGIAIWLEDYLNTDFGEFTFDCEQ